MSKNQRIWTLFFGVITALVVVISQLFWFQGAGFLKGKAATEQTAKAEEQGEAHISLPSSSLPSNHSVELQQEFSFLHEIFTEEETTTEVASTVSTAVGKFFETLFRVIIAPNAP
jgi:hypothetical protein